MMVLHAVMETLFCQLYMISAREHLQRNCTETQQSDLISGYLTMPDLLSCTELYYKVAGHVVYLHDITVRFHPLPEINACY